MGREEREEKQAAGRAGVEDDGRGAGGRDQIEVAFKCRHTCVPGQSGENACTWTPPKLKGPAEERARLEKQTQTMFII